MGGLVERDISEEGVKRGEPGVATARGIPAITLEVIEKVAKKAGVEVRERELGRRPAEARGGEAQEQPEGGAICGDGVRARLALPDQTVGEEGLQQRRELGGRHGTSSRSFVARSVASWRSSGTASMYQ